MERALAESPADVDLQLRYAQLLLEANRPVDALTQAQLLLAGHPAWSEALIVALRAAHATGDAELALGYRRLLGALGAGVPPLGERLAVGEDAPADDRAAASEDPDVDRPRVTLADVGGLENVKARLEQAFLGPLRNPELAKAFGKSSRGGLLLYGPPGCGKTFVARALAGEMGASFYPIGIPAVLDMWVGASERNMHEVFETARRNAPCVLFFDEIDALGQRRTHLRNAPSMRATVNVLLAELDGVDTDNDGVFVLGATNQPWDIDPALLRPGRFDRTILVVPPDEQARIAILAHHLKNRPVSEALDLSTLAAATDGYSGADLAAVCESAVELALARSVDEGRLSPVSAADLADSKNQVLPSVASWFETAGSIAKFANVDGQYDELLRYLGSRRKK